MSECLFFNFNVMDEFVTALAAKNDISKELLAELARDYCLSGYHDGQIKKELESFVSSKKKFAGK